MYIISYNCLQCEICWKSYITFYFCYVILTFLYRSEFVYSLNRIYKNRLILEYDHKMFSQNNQKAEAVNIFPTGSKLDFPQVLLSWVCLFVFSILAKHRHKLETTELQFGFKHDHSVTQCSFAVKEVIQYYKNKNSSVHIMLLDASQAFDRVNYGVLFETLLKCGLCAVISRLLLNLSTHQIMCVKWSEIIPKPFTPVNGVKQGGILSPILFTVYIDAIFVDFTKQSIGCHIGHTFMGAFGYADDIISIQKLLDQHVTNCKEICQHT